MSTGEFTDWLRKALARSDFSDLGRRLLASGTPPIDVEMVADFRSAGILTANDGLVITTTDGDEFQVTIVQTHYGYGGLGRHA